MLQAPNGEDALTLSRGHRGNIHAVISDIVMPGMGGRVLAATLLAERPGLKSLLLSGYTDEAVLRHELIGAGTGYLQKPFSPDALLRKVREVLDASS